MILGAPTNFETVTLSGGRTLIVLTDARQCPGCRTMHYWFVNTMGRTTCSGCAPDQRAA